MSMRIAGLAAALLCGGISWTMVPARAEPASGQPALQADIWARLSLGSHGVVIASIFVHTAFNTRCSAGVSNAKTGPLQRATPRAFVTADDGMARFRTPLPPHAAAGVHWVSATCDNPGTAHRPARSVTVQSSFSLPYNAAANAVPPRPPVQVTVEPAIVTYKHAVTLRVRSIPDGLCTAVVQEESANGVSRLSVDPFRVSQDGTAQQPIVPTDFGTAIVTVTCDAHKNFAAAQATFTVQ